MSLPAAIGLPRPRAAVLARIAWLAPARDRHARAGGRRTAARRPATGCPGRSSPCWPPARCWRSTSCACAAASGWSRSAASRASPSGAASRCCGPGCPATRPTEASRALFYASAFAIVLLAIRTQRDAATMVGLIATATGLVTLYGCVRLAQGAPDSWMIYQRVGWPTGYPNTSASLGVLGFWTLVGVGAERRLAWPARSLALAAAVPAIGFALLTQSRGAALTLILVSPFAIALVRERLRLTAFTLVALAGLLPAIPALRTAIDTGSEADAGTAAGAPAARRRPRRGRRRCDRTRRPAHLDLAGAPAPARPRRCRGHRRSSRCCWPASRCSRTRRGASPAPSTRSRRSTPRTTADRTCSRSSPIAGTSGRSPQAISLRGR